jgi:integrase
LSEFVPIEPEILKEWNKTEKRFIYHLDYYDEHGGRKRPSTHLSSLTFVRQLLTNKKDEVAKRKLLPDRYIDLTIQALTVLRSLPKRGEYVFCDVKGKPFKNFRRSFESAVNRAGLKDVVIHDLRRTFGSN